MRFPIKITSSYIGLPYQLIELFYFFWYACGADGQSDGWSVYGHVITKSSRIGSLPHFLTHGAPLRARELL